jgi:hypothetical protein
LGPRMTVSELLRVAAEIEPGKVSDFTSAADGGFVMFVQSRLRRPTRRSRRSCRHSSPRPASTGALHRSWCGSESGSRRPMFECRRPVSRPPTLRRPIDTSPPPVMAEGPEGEAAVLKLSAPGAAGYWEVPVLHEDGHLLAIDKPAGLLTSPDRYDRERPNLMRLLHAHIARGAPWARERGLGYLANAHRLDFETSGVLLWRRPNRCSPCWPISSVRESRRRPTSPSRRRASRRYLRVEVKLAPHPARPGVVRVDPSWGSGAGPGFGW